MITTRYTLCPNGARTTQDGNRGAEWGQDGGAAIDCTCTNPHLIPHYPLQACEHDERCVGVTLGGGGASLLGYGYKGAGLCMGFASYTVHAHPCCV